jgi:catechol 2,3-dioxygenase-like lactoylglutathione lyase family enzyme
MLQKHIVGVDHVALQLPDLDEGLWFFNELLGFKVKFETVFEGQKIVMLQAGKIEIEMWEHREGVEESAPAPANGVHHLAIGVKRLDDVMAHAKKAGLDVLADVYEPTRGIREAMVGGPGGTRIQFVEQNVPLLIWRAVTGDFE